ncbi:DUF362 domain-containing protein [Calderihabitans maritimus]|uniref:4Fe-4S ferredoxin n=1 Tax=Calderihabitans maritimus TaxID=1246530 RepID=A0A1Z5HUE9_9FIRM|nr:4Fe-4S binding protein [Calderihabitans maritimus]GAW93163.1 4Fe-4S ferredoxin [Calderihabitans maritimus]
MPFRITGDCIACGGCSVVCPVDAIDDGFGSGEGGDDALYSISDHCEECGLCLDVCPVEAIKKEDLS